MTYRTSEEVRDELIWQLWEEDGYTVNHIYEIFRVKMGDIDRIINEQREKHKQTNILGEVKG